MDERVPRVAVVGSFVMDLVVWVDHLPRKPETQVPSRFEVHPGGKGFNQAVTARRCGADVAMIGALGADSHGDAFVSLMERMAIEARVRRTDGQTSFAVPMIDAEANNSILLVQQANLELSAADVERARDAIAGADVLMLQLEVPVDASLAAARIARASGTTTIFNPAPAADGIEALLPLSGWLIPNEVEAEALSGVAVTDSATAQEAARALLRLGVRDGVIVTLGARGCVVGTPDRVWHVPPFAVEAVDPTGAGDAFCGAFAVALAERVALPDAIAMASAAGALAATQAGAEPSLPTRAAVERLLASRS